MNVALLGFGVVGRGVYDLLAPRDDLDVKYVVCLEDITLPDAKVTRNYREILEDEDLDTVVEAMGGLHPAFEFVRDAILAGKNIVNKLQAFENVVFKISSVVVFLISAIFSADRYIIAE